MFYSSRKRWSNRKAARAAQDVFNNVMDSSRRGIAGRVYVATPLKEIATQLALWHTFTEKH